MKKLMLICTVALFTLGTTACSSTRKTVRADPDATKYKPMRTRTTATDPEPTPGHQNREIQNTYNQR